MLNFMRDDIELPEPEMEEDEDEQILNILLSFFS